MQESLIQRWIDKTPFTTSEMSILIFREIQQRLSDLLIGTEREYIPYPSAEKYYTPPVQPDSRLARLCARNLPSNPYFKEYARQARVVLGLPLEGVDRCDTTDFAETLGYPIAIDRSITAWLWAAWWLAIHSVKSRCPVPSIVEGLPTSLPKWLHEYGLQEQVIPVAETDWPLWTDRQPRYPGSDPTLAENSPIDLIAGLFLSAFDLPSRCFSFIQWYILTDYEVFLDFDPNPLEVQFDAPIGADGRVRFSIMVDGLDSATTKADWVEIWDQKLAPFVDHLYVNETQQERWRTDRLREETVEDLIRRGRRGNKSDMKTPEYAGFFELLYNRPTDDLKDALTDYMGKFPEDSSVNENTDLRTLKTNVDRLERIMRPRTKIT